MGKISLKLFMVLLDVAFRCLLIRRGGDLIAKLQDVSNFRISVQNKLSEIQFLKSYQFLLEETDFLASGNHVFPSMFGHSCLWQLFFSSSRNVFLIESCIPFSGNAFSGQWQPFVMYFLHIRASECFFPVSWKCVFETNPSLWLLKMDFLASGNLFFVIFQILLAAKAIFFVQPKLIFQQILHFAQWKLIFWLMKIIWFMFLKYPVQWKQFFHLVEIYFKRNLLQPVATDFLFSRNNILLFFFFFRNPYCDKRQANIEKNLSFASGNRFLQLDAQCQSNSVL